MIVLNDNSPMPFGKYSGRALTDVPATYLIWLYENNKTTTPLKVYIEENLDVLKEEIKREANKRERAGR